MEAGGRKQLCREALKKGLIFCQIISLKTFSMSATPLRVRNETLIEKESLRLSGCYTTLQSADEARDILFAILFIGCPI